VSHWSMCVCVYCSLETGSAVSKELMCLTGACVCVCAVVWRLAVLSLSS